MSVLEQTDASAGARPEGVPDTMAAVVMSGYGDPSVLTVAHLPTPRPGPAEVLIRVEAAGVNPFDAKIRRGYLARFFEPPFPHVLGADYAGVVVETGPGVQGLEVGDRVWGLTIPVRHGSYARHLVLPFPLVRKAPPSLSFEEAASIPMGALTAWLALTRFGQVKAGDKVLIHAGAGGVGGYAVQIAKRLGAHVTATCSAKNVDHVKALGADVAVDYENEDVAAVVKDQDWALDTVGGETSVKTYASMKRGGTILLVERGHPIEMQNRERMTREHGVTLVEVAFDQDPPGLDALASAVEEGWLKPTLSTVLPLGEAKTAHEMIETRRTRGKIVLKTAG